MICWSCEKHVHSAASPCASCGAILPPDDAADAFAVLGLPRRFALDLADAEARFKKAARDCHPDRFVKADARARKAAFGRSVQLNEAWRTVREPGRRAQYLLALGGIDMADDAQAKRYAPQELLMEVLELRSALGEAREAGDDATVTRMAAEVGARADAALGAIGRALDAEPPALETAARELAALRYWQRFLEEAEAHAEARAEGETASGPQAGQAPPAGATRGAPAAASGGSSRG